VNNTLKLLRWLAIILLTTFALFSSYELAEKANDLLAFPGNNDYVSGWEKRMELVKKRLPEGITVIGYVADWDIPGISMNLIDLDNEYMLTQYSLVPIKVVPGLEAEWILGNFGSPSYQAWLDKSLQDYEIRDLGYHLYLIHKMSP